MTFADFADFQNVLHAFGSRSADRVEHTNTPYIVVGTWCAVIL